MHFAGCHSLEKSKKHSEWSNYLSFRQWLQNHTLAPFYHRHRTTAEALSTEEPTHNSFKCCP